MRWTALACLVAEAAGFTATRGHTTPLRASVALAVLPPEPPLIVVTNATDRNRPGAAPTTESNVLDAANPIEGTWTATSITFAVLAAINLPLLFSAEMDGDARAEVLRFAMPVLFSVPLGAAALWAIIFLDKPDEKG